VNGHEEAWVIIVCTIALCITICSVVSSLTARYRYEDNDPEDKDKGT
jgi:hypothetical protein